MTETPSKTAVEKDLVPLTTFEQFNLGEPASKALQEMGFLNPTPIQLDTLPILLGSPTDFIGLAATGTGKTAAFTLPLIEKIDTTLNSVQALVLCPTRELAIQVCDQIKKLGKYAGIKALPIYGGSGYNEQFYGLKRGVHVVVATPGRLVDHINRKTIKLDLVKTVVLDEADEMISMGFKDDMDIILKETHDRKTWLFSATMNPEIRRIAHKHLHDPKTVQVNKTEVLSENVQQIYYVTKESNKPEVLCKIIDSSENFYGLIFCQTKALVSDTAQLLQRKGYRVDCLHGDKDQKARERILHSFRNKTVTILVCTDVAARGLDVKDLTHVVNYSIPRELDSYVHRIGRTARSGKSGIAISLVTQSHMGLISRLEKMTRSKMKQGLIPTRKDIGSKKLVHFLPKFLEVQGFERAHALLDQTWQDAMANMTKSEVAARFLALSYQDLFVDKDNKPEVDLNEKPSASGRSFEGRGGRIGGGYRGNRDSGGGYSRGGGGGRRSFSSGGYKGTKPRSGDKPSTSAGATSRGNEGHSAISDATSVRPNTTSGVGATSAARRPQRNYAGGGGSSRSAGYKGKRDDQRH